MTQEHTSTTCPPKSTTTEHTSTTETSTTEGPTTTLVTVPTSVTTVATVPTTVATTIPVTVTTQVPVGTPPNELPHTGASSGPLAAFGLSFVLIGALILRATRKRLTHS